MPGHGCSTPGVSALAVREGNPELEAARAAVAIPLRSDVLAALINAQPSICCGRQPWQNATSTLGRHAPGRHGPRPHRLMIVDGSGLQTTARVGQGPLLVAEPTNRFARWSSSGPSLGADPPTLERMHTATYPNLEALVETLTEFADGCGPCPGEQRIVPRAAETFLPGACVVDSKRLKGVDFRRPRPSRPWRRHCCLISMNPGSVWAGVRLPLPGRHNPANATARPGCLPVWPGLSSLS